MKTFTITALSLTLALASTSALAEGKKGSKGATCEHCGKKEGECKKCKGKKKCDCKKDDAHAEGHGEHKADDHGHSH